MRYEYLPCGHLALVAPGWRTCTCPDCGRVCEQINTK